MSSEIFESGIFKEEIVVIKDGKEIKLPLDPINLEDCDEKVFIDVASKLKKLDKAIENIDVSYQIYRSFPTKKIFVTPKNCR